MSVTELYDVKACSKSISLKVNSSLLEQVQEFDIDISVFFKECLEDVLWRKVQEKQWLKENKKAIAAHNKFVKKHGVFSEKWRKFYGSI